MFSIYDGREEFYQWDKDRKIIVDDSSIKEVHFCNKTEDCSIVCEVYFMDDDFGGLYVANVPNELLQTNWRINVYGYTGDYTKHSKCFKVNPRSKPADYIYTPTEIKNYETIQETANEAIEKANEAKEMAMIETTKASKEASVSPVEGSSIGVITRLYEMPTDLLADGKWEDMENWETTCDEEYWNWTLIYYIDGVKAGTLQFSGSIGGSIDMNGCDVYDVDESGNIAESVFEGKWYPNDGDFNVTADFYDRYGTGKIAIVLYTIGNWQFLSGLQMLNTARSDFFDGYDIQLTVIKDGVETTYKAEPPCLDWAPNQGYNWITGKGLDEKGNNIEDAEGYTDWNGNAYPELATIGEATFISKVGTTEITYKAYPTEAVNNLQAQVDALRVDVVNLKETVNYIRSMMGW